MSQASLTLRSMEWLLLTAKDDPDPAGRPIPVREVGHAYNSETGCPAHAITTPNQFLTGQRWESPLPDESARCPRCAEIVAGPEDG